MKRTIVLKESELISLINKIIKEDLSFKDDSNDPYYGKTFNKNKHYEWFNTFNPKLNDDIKDNIITISDIHNELGKVANTYKPYGYNLRKIIAKDKDKIIGFLIWATKGLKIDDIGDGKEYPVILSTAVDPNYRNRGVLKNMIKKSKIGKPFLVQTSLISPPGLWKKFGCQTVKTLPGHMGFIEKCE